VEIDGEHKRSAASSDYLSLSVPVTTPAAVFTAAGTDPREAALASFKRDLRADRYGHDDSHPDYPMMTERESEIADVWSQAHDAAIAACCAGWTAVPSDAGLSLVRNLPLVPRSGPHIEFEAEV